MLTALNIKKCRYKQKVFVEKWFRMLKDKRCMKIEVVEPITVLMWAICDNVMDIELCALLLIFFS